MHTELDLIGIFALGISGAVMAIRLDFDIVGIAILAVITALGGRILRDLLLGDTPPPGSRSGSTSSCRSPQPLRAWIPPPADSTAGKTPATPHMPGSVRWT